MGAYGAGADRAGHPVVGIVGGGQLARMTVEAAARLGVDARVLARPEDEAARAVWPAVDEGDGADPLVLEAFSRSCDVLTFDHEGVDPDVVEALTRLGRRVHPGAAALRLCDKSMQRTELTLLGFPVPPFAVVRTVGEVAAFARENGGWPVVAKSPRGGFDGRGVRMLEGEEQALVALALAGDAPLLLEPALAIERELAVLVARRPGGQRVVYPVVETFQRDGMCRSTVAPAPVDPRLAAEATEIAVAIAELVDVVGILAVELFVVDGAIVVNEIAPRPHNSGHWTIEGCATSQFENHLRAVLDWPLGAATLRAAAVATVNIVGSAADPDPRTRLPLALAVDDAHVHLYGKTSRPGRKLGHVTALGTAPGPALDTASRAVDALRGLVAPATDARIAS